MRTKTVMETFLKYTVNLLSPVRKCEKKDFVKAVGLIEMGLSVMPDSYTTLQNMSVFHEPLRGNLVNFT